MNTSLYCNFVAFYTIAHKEWARVIRIWMQTLIPPVITTALYFVIFGRVIGQNMPAIHGYDYIAYIFPGLVIMSMLTNSYNNVATSFFTSKIQREIEAILVSPMSSVTIVVGYAMGGILRGLLVGIVVFFVGYLFTTVPIVHPISFIVTIIFTTTLFSLGGLINGIYSRKPDDVAMFSTFIITPLTYLGGVFYSVNSLGEPWSTISKFNPLTYVINAFRYSMLGVSDLPIGVALMAIIVVTLIAFFFACHLMAKSKSLRG